MNKSTIYLLFLGWVIYWVLAMGKSYRSNISKIIPLDFLKINVFEIAGSLLLCVAIVILGPNVPNSWFDVTKPVNVFLAGIGSTVLLHTIASIAFPSKVPTMVISGGSLPAIATNPK